jgi:hypothetical protein
MELVGRGARTLANIFTQLVTPENIRRFEVTIIRLAVLFFVGHLALLFLLNNVPALYRGHSINYLKAIYTPFSFILVYEVFLLVIILPESMTEFIAKQFEIITLITLRSFFHDIASVPLHSPIHASDPAVLSLGYDLIASLVMFSLTVVFHRLHLRHHEHEGQVTPLHTFIDLKKSVSVFLIVVLLVTSVYSFTLWTAGAVEALLHHSEFPDPNSFFYIDFFNVMIYADVLLLIISFLYDSSFFSVVRNASFIISTVLLRISLSMERPMNHLVAITAFSFSVAVMVVLHIRHKRWFSPAQS